MLKLLKNFSKRDWALVIVSFGLIVFQVWLELTMPDYMSKITTLVQTEGSKMSDKLMVDTCYCVLLVHLYRQLL